MVYNAFVQKYYKCVGAGLSRSDNGIRVMLYMTLILAILIIAYKKINNLKGYKTPKLKFANELEADIIKEIVILCGGQPLKMKHLFNDC